MPREILQSNGDSMCVQYCTWIGVRRCSSSKPWGYFGWVFDEFGSCWFGESVEQMHSWPSEFEFKKRDVTLPRSGSVPATLQNTWRLDERCVGALHVRRLNEPIVKTSYVASHSEAAFSTGRASNANSFVKWSLSATANVMFREAGLVAAWRHIRETCMALGLNPISCGLGKCVPSAFFVSPLNYLLSWGWMLQ